MWGPLVLRLKVHTVRYATGGGSWGSYYLKERQSSGKCKYAAKKPSVPTTFGDHCRNGIIERKGTYEKEMSALITSVLPCEIRL